MISLNGDDGATKMKQLSTIIISTLVILSVLSLHHDSKGAAGRVELYGNCGVATEIDDVTGEEGHHLACRESQSTLSLISITMSCKAKSTSITIVSTALASLGIKYPNPDNVTISYFVNDMPMGGGIFDFSVAQASSRSLRSHDGFVENIRPDVPFNFLIYSQQKTKAASIELNNTEYQAIKDYRTRCARIAVEVVDEQLQGRDDQAFSMAEAEDTVASYSKYLVLYPEGPHVQEALRRILLLESNEGPILDWATGTTFRDCADCPEMVVLPKGEFQMGNLDGSGKLEEVPVHTVSVAYRFAVGKYEVTRAEYASFVNSNGYHSGEGCRYLWGSSWGMYSDSSWRDPGVNQTDRDAVVCINWDDAKAYATWLSRKTGEKYRLLTESEWEYATRAGTRTSYSFGNHISAICDHGNGDPQRMHNGGKSESCDDEFEHTAPVGSMAANAFGIYDVHGNVWEWTEDCWNDNYVSAPTDGSAWMSGDCRFRVLRGGGWASGTEDLRSAARNRDDKAHRTIYYGFRLARTLE